MNRATFDIPRKTLAEAPQRKFGRWQYVLVERAHQGRFTWTHQRVIDSDRVRISFEWPQEQHAWVRRFLGRFTRAWASEKPCEH